MFIPGLEIVARASFERQLESDEAVGRLVAQEHLALLKSGEQVFDLRPAKIISYLDLRRPIYRDTAAYGHFGRNDLDLPWEKLDKVDDLKKYL